MQWKIAISWTSGYLAFQLFTPLLFRYQNATVAGQMGMTIYISNIALGHRHCLAFNKISTLWGNDKE